VHAKTFYKNYCLTFISTYFDIFSYKGTGDKNMISWVAILSVGILLGLVAGFYYSMLSGSDKKRLQELESKLKEAESSMSGYKQNVTDHFVTTSNLINNMTESYRAIHDHMSNGAKTLCSQSLLDSPASQYQLDIPEATAPDSTPTEKQTTVSTNQESETTATQDTPETETTDKATVEDINKTDAVAVAADTDTTTTSDISSSTEDAAKKETDSVTAVTQQLDIAAIASAATATSEINSATPSESTETDSDTANEPADTIGKPIDIDEKEKSLLFDKKKDQNSNVIH